MCSLSIRYQLRLVAALVVSLLMNVAHAEDSWQAGAAKVKITPETPLAMSGYGGRDQPAEDKLTDLWAKALIIEDQEGQRAVLLSLDLVGIDRTFSQDVCDRLQRQYGLERRQIAICCSHTHTGPVVGRNLAPLHYLVHDKEQQRRIDEYVDVLQEKVITVTGRALRQLEPCRLAWASGSATFAVNRRNNPESDVPKLRTAGKLTGPFDHDVPVLSVRNASGILRAVVFGYACHATVLNSNQWSGDYPGFAQAELEENYPDCTALFFAGCGGDQNPLPRRTVELARHYGRRLADAVDSVLLTSAMQPIDGSLVMTYDEIGLALDQLPSREQVAEDVKSSNRYVSNRARLLLNQLDTVGKLSPTYPYPIGVWKLGSEVQLVTLGGEVVVDYALRLKRELSGSKTWVAGYANDVMAYIPSRRVLQEGGYEGARAMVYYGLPTVWSPLCEQMIVNEVHEQIGQN